MKKPEPWPVMTSWPPGLPGTLGMPKRLKKRSNGEPGGNGRSSSLSSAVLVGTVDLDPHRNHRGLHLLDDVGKAHRALRQLLHLFGRDSAPAPRCQSDCHSTACSARTKTPRRRCRRAVRQKRNAPRGKNAPRLQGNDGSLAVSKSMVRRMTKRHATRVARHLADPLLTQKMGAPTLTALCRQH